MKYGAMKVCNIWKYIV